MKNSPPPELSVDRQCAAHYAGMFLFFDMPRGNTDLHHLARLGHLSYLNQCPTYFLLWFSLRLPPHCAISFILDRSCTPANNDAGSNRFSGETVGRRCVSPTCATKSQSFSFEGFCNGLDCATLRGSALELRDQFVSERAAVIVGKPEQASTEAGCSPATCVRLFIWRIGDHAIEHI